MKLLVASSNKGKLAEFKRIFAEYRIEVLPQSACGVSDAVEDGRTFIENAILKARNACEQSGQAAIADDSGLVVPALGGAPGIYSARYAQAGAHENADAKNNAKLLAEMEKLEPGQRSACFRCVLAFMRSADDPSPLIFEGSWWGEILREPRGENGFGYDPLFFVAEHNCSSAELAPEVKNRISHRGQAMAALVTQLDDVTRN